MDHTNMHPKDLDSPRRELSTVVSKLSYPLRLVRELIFRVFILGLQSSYKKQEVLKNYRKPMDTNFFYDRNIRTSVRLSSQQYIELNYRKFEMKPSRRHQIVKTTQSNKHV